MKTLVERFVDESPENMRLFLQERMILAIAHLLTTRMHELKITQTALAKRLGRTRWWIEKMLNDGEYTSLRELVEVFAAIGDELVVSSKPIQISNANPVQT